jgi:short-subunit dehydrogenase
MGFDASGKSVLVTGGSSGIGAALAVAFARHGAKVGLAARRAGRLNEVLARCREHSPASQMWVTDLSDPEAADRLAAAATDGLGGVDVLVNCAGMPKRRHVTRLDSATVELVMQVNYLSAARLTLALLPGMLERGEGRIVSISSVAATLSSPGEAAYSASKAALAVFSESMAVDLWDTGVKVMIVYPGVIDTELFQLPDNDPLLPGVEAIPVEDAVQAIFVGLERDALQIYVPEHFSQYATGKAANVEGFLAATAEYVRSNRP